MSDIKVTQHAFHARRGDTFRKVCTIQHEAYILTGHTITMEVAKKDGTGVLKFTTLDGSILLNDAYSFTLLKSPSAMQAVEPGCYKYDIKVTTPAGAVTTWWEGPFHVIQSVTGSSTWI